jgi:acyl-coenzyme A synthetase/AMP-(fatty) acid ligase
MMLNTPIICINTWNRTIHGDHVRFLKTYFEPIQGMLLYMLEEYIRIADGLIGYFTTGDEATRDRDGFFWIRGRLDGDLLICFYLSDSTLMSYRRNQCVRT